MSALDRQIGADHYKNYSIQPVEFCMMNRLDYCQSNIIKYVVRFRDKGGKQDLLKAKHYLELLWEMEYGQDNKTTSAKSEPRYTYPETDIQTGYSIKTEQPDYTAYHSKQGGCCK